MLRRQLGWACIMLIVSAQSLLAADAASTGIADPIVLNQLSLRQAEQLFAGGNRELLAAKRAVEGA